MNPSALSLSTVELPPLLQFCATLPEIFLRSQDAPVIQDQLVQHIPVLRPPPLRLTLGQAGEDVCQAFARLTVKVGANLAAHVQSGQYFTDRNIEMA